VFCWSFFLSSLIFFAPPGLSLNYHLKVFATYPRGVFGAFPRFMTLIEIVGNVFDWETFLGI